jgi:hypothetical protein
MRDRELLQRRSPTRSRSFRRRLEVTVCTLAQSTANVIFRGPHEAERVCGRGLHNSDGQHTTGVGKHCVAAVGLLIGMHSAIPLIQRPCPLCTAMASKHAFCELGCKYRENQAHIPVRLLTRSQPSVCADSSPCTRPLQTSISVRNHCITTSGAIAC